MCGPAILCHLACRSSNGHHIFPCVWRRAACECRILHARRELVSFGTVRGPPIGLLFCVRLHHRGRDWRDHDRWLRGRRRHRRGTCGKLVVAEGSCAIGEAPEVLLEPSPRNLRRFIDSQPPHPMDMTDIWAIWGGAASQVRQITNKGGGHLQPGRLVFGSAQGEERRACVPDERGLTASRRATVTELWATNPAVTEACVPFSGDTMPSAAQRRGAETGESTAPRTIRALLSSVHETSQPGSRCWTGQNGTRRASR